MRTTRLASAAAAVATLLLSVCLAGPALASSEPTWTISQISSVASYQYPQLELVGGRAAWTAEWNGHSQVFTWDTTSGVASRLTTAPSDNNDPRVSGDRLVWSGAEGANTQVFTWAKGDSAPTMLTSGGQNHQQPRVYGDMVLWTALQGGHYQVEFTEGVNPPNPLILTGDAHDHQDPVLSDSLAAWQGVDAIGRNQIYMYDLYDYDVSQLTSATGGSMPVLSGDRLAFSGYADGRDQVFTWKRGDESQLTTLTSDIQMHADIGISGDRVAWRTETNTGQGWIVHTWAPPASQPTTVPASRFAQGVNVGGDRLVWLQQDYPLTTWKLFTWKAGESAPTTISANCDGYSDPQVSGDRIVWRGQDMQIRLATFVPASPPATTTLTKPGVSPSTPRKGKTASFSATIKPKAGARGAVSKLYLSRRETKRVSGKKVRYWHLRYTITMKGSSTGRLTATKKIGYTGSWKAVVKCAGSSAYKKCTSTTRYFSVK